MKRNPLPFLISPHSEIDGKLNDEINVQALPVNMPAAVATKLRREIQCGTNTREKTIVYR